MIVAPSEFVQFCVEYSTIALLYYDYSLTFTAEVRFIWNQRFRLSTLLYLLCREGCDLGYRISAGISILGRLAVLTVWGIRTYAIWSGNKIIGAWFLAVGLGCIVTNIIAVFNAQCDWQDSIPLAGLLFGVLLIIFEFSATILTIARSAQALRIMGGWRLHDKGLYALLMEQGVLYLIVVCIFTAIPYLVNIILHAPAIQRLLNAYPMPITGLMTARFLLYLRKWEERRCISRNNEETHAPNDTLRFRHSGTIIFTSFVEELGEDPVASAQRNREVEWTA